MDGHLWVQSKTWDPEGLVSTLPAICNLLLGCLAGRWIDQALPRPEKTVWLLLAGLACLWMGSMLDVALMVGFRTQAHFSAVFKKLTGLPPRRWRQTELAARLPADIAEPRVWPNTGLF